MKSPLRLAGLLAAGVVFASGVCGAAEAKHSFLLTYRDFGSITATSTFQKADGYAVRFEGCFARHSDAAICGFTIRPTVPLTLTNAQNLSHGSDDAGGAIRTCCLFIQGNNQGFPISAAPAAPQAVAVIDRALKPGETIGVLLRVPNYKTVARLAAITFSHGQGDKGVQFPTRIQELP
ncbi:MAG TPA: hypothetical protein VH353_08960 [Caulobacteraceae bacterium]|nr:hypothetical protein [Caulobacteraceae bacterium]